MNIRDQGEDGTAEKSANGGDATTSGATTRRSFSEIRQKYCKIKEQEQ